MFDDILADSIQRTDVTDRKTHTTSASTAFTHGVAW